MAPVGMVIVETGIRHLPGIGTGVPDSGEVDIPEAGLSPDSDTDLSPDRDRDPAPDPEQSPGLWRWIQYTVR
jgi:hypothetical protein